MTIRGMAVATALLGLVASARLAMAADKTDVTAAVTAAVKGDRLAIVASNAVFGDPVPGVAKKLIVQYRIGDEKLLREVAEDGRLVIAAPAGQKLVVLEATYGPADGAKPVDFSNPESWLDALPGFRIEHVHDADGKTNGSWISLANDPQGRLLLGGQRGQPITRLTLQDGRVVKAETLSIPVTEVMGMLFVDRTLYLNGAGPDGKFGLYRCTDAAGDGGSFEVELLRRWNGGGGEHGTHGIALGPDRKLYVVCGNFVHVPEDLAPASPHRNYGDDLPQKRAEDGNGFGAGRRPPGGFIARLDLDGKNCELFSGGQRNAYDIGFNADGELFGFDSDMEWDWGTPWYRPIHVFHAVSGADHGFREGSAKWPEHYPDGLPPSTTIGIGCPTGVAFGTGARFPVRYQKALFICDWTYGRLMAVHLTPRGAGYTGTFENFVAPAALRTGKDKRPLNLTDCVVGADGSLYFTIGGRGTKASLFRVVYVGDEAAAPLPAAALRDKAAAEPRAVRRRLEALNVRPDPAAVDEAWPHLSSDDRFIRYAARLAVERNPLAQWQARALAEKHPQAALTALLAVARLAPADTQPALIAALAAIPSAGLAEHLLLDKLRVIGVSIARQGVPTGPAARQLLADIDPLYPHSSAVVNRELAQILLAVDTPHAVTRTVDLLEKATTLEEQIAYVMALRNVRNGWTEAARRTYLAWWKTGRSTAHPEQMAAWFKQAGVPASNGASLEGFLRNAFNEAKGTLTPVEIAALGDLLKDSAAAKPAQPAPAAVARTLVRDWKTADLQPLLDEVGKGRNFNRGRDVYREAQCAACHRYGDQGGAVGPDLTAVAARFKRQDLLEAMTEPSKVVSEQYMNTAIETKDGRVVVGRVVEETPEAIVVRPNPLEDKTVTIAKAGIESRSPSRVSPMPGGLLNTFTRDEILDLIAYMESQGDPDHANFRR